MKTRKTRTLGDGRIVALRDNNGLRKRCGCARRAWSSCAHAWHFSFKWKPTEKCKSGHHRFPIDKHAERPIITKDDARDEADRLRRLIRAGGFPPQPATPATTPEALTFETFAEKWRTNARAQQSENQQLNDAGIVRRLSKIELSGLPLGQRPIGLFTVDDWETAFAALGTLAASSRNKYRQAVLAMQEWAVDKGYLARPWLTGKVIKKGGSIARRKGARRDRRLVSDVFDAKGKVKHPGEEARLMKHASPWLQRLIVAALETGARRGELLALTWADVSMSRLQVTIRAETTKARSMRQVPISTRLLGILKMIQHDPTGSAHPPATFVFGDKIGGKVCDPKKSWAKCCTAAEVVGLHFHDLRHEAGSRLLEQGWALHHVQKMLGHQDAKTTSIYLNAGINELQDSMRRFGTGGDQSLPDVAHAAESERPPTGNEAASEVAKPLVN